MMKIKAETTTVDSTLVKSMSYYRETGNLYVTFKNGTLYCYSDVDIATYDTVRRSESIGKALHKEIFKVYKYRKL